MRPVHIGMGALLTAVLCVGAAGTGFAQDVSVDLGTLPEGKKVRVVFDVTVDNPVSGPLVMSVENQGTVSSTTGAFSTVPTDDPDDPTSLVDPTRTALDGLTIGDQVWQDLDLNNVFDGTRTDATIDGVTLNLYLDDGDGVLDAGDGAAIATTVSASGGLYSFTGLQPGDYIVEIDPCNFTGMGCTAVLAGLGSIPPVPAADPDDDVDNDDNGDNVAGFGVAARALTLAFGAEPTTDGDMDADTNLTVDFGFADVGDLEIVSKTDSPDPVVAGENLTYTISFINNGPGSASTVMVTDATPANTTFVSAMVTTGTGWMTSTPTVGGTGNVVFSKPSVASGETATFTITVAVDPALAGGSTITNTATVSSSTNDPTPGNDSKTAMTTTIAEADLSASKSDSQDPVFAGGTLTYTVTVDNAGPSDATNVSVTDTLPAGVTFGSTSGCAESPAGGVPTCTLGTIAAGGSKQYTIEVTVATSTSGTITNQATVSSAVTDPDVSNNTATEDTTVQQLDFGDAPDSGGLTISGYHTLLVNDGARHQIGSLFLGAAVDAEADGQPTADADGDDTDAEGDDEDGVAFTSVVAAGETVTLDVTASAMGLLNAWVDFNGNGNWADPGEQIFVDEPLVAGVNALSFAVPPTATTGDTYARFRLAGGVVDLVNGGASSPNGFAADGEVEDYKVTILGLDFGDAPDPVMGDPGEYPTLRAFDGARHALAGGPILGAIIDAELDGQPTADADGDDTADSDDEDGVSFTSLLIRGKTATVDVVASAAGALLNAWVDFDQSGTWDSPGERVLTNTALAMGVNSLSFAVPAGATPGETFARFRLDTGGGLAPTGLAEDGEVEDYKVEVVQPAIGDTVFCDNAPQNGMFDAGEGLAAITVRLLTDANCDGTPDEGTAESQSTVGDGQYLFTQHGGGELVIGPAGGPPVCYVATVDTTDPDLAGCTAPITPTSFPVALTEAAPVSLVNDFGFVPAAAAVPFTKAFSPSTIGPGSTSTLVFTINNLSPSVPVSDLAFTDNLPAGVTIADPPKASTTCANGTVSAPAGGGTIGFSGGQLGTSRSCTVRVDVTSSTVGTHTNVSEELNSSAGTGGEATADLVVATDRPGFTKLFTPSTVSVGGRSTLTFTIDNTAIGSSAVASLAFTDNLPAGMVIASPANAATTCGSGSPFFPVDLTATPGTSLVDFFAPGFTPNFPALAAGASCTVTVDVIGNVTGSLGNTSGNLVAVVGVQARDCGKASDTLVVTATEIVLIKSFTDDPVPPGGQVTLQFRIENRNRDFAATGIGFTDDLKFTPSMGLVRSGGPTPDPPCGAGSTLAGTSLLTLAGGTLPPGGICTFRVTLDVPAGETLGAFENVTSAITGTVDGAGVTGNVAREKLFVEPVPRLEKQFLDASDDSPDPVVGAGDDVKIRFKVTNTSTTSGASDVGFVDVLTNFLPSPVTVSAPMPDPPCGAGSTLTGTDTLTLAGGSLTAAPGMGSSCTFDVIVSLPDGLPAGIYVNVTTPVTATVDDATRTGNSAVASFEVVGAPRLTKEFSTTDDGPAQPGDVVTLEFTLEHEPDAPAAATEITFTDDLTAVIMGLEAIGLPDPGMACNGTGTLSGTDQLTFSGGVLAPGESCTFAAILQVPLSAPTGFHTNETSNVVATVGGIQTTGNKATADLQVGGLFLTKEFLDDPVVPGGTVTLEFNITNLSPGSATEIFFEDDLDATLTGLTVDPASVPADPCGSGSSILLTAGDSLLTLLNGTLATGELCTFSVTLDVPTGAASDTYTNTTELFRGRIDGTLLFFPDASDELVVDANFIRLTKRFSTRAAAPGSSVDLTFTVTNLDPDNPATDIAFTDTLPAGLSAIMLPTAGAACNGSGTLSGATTLSFSGGVLAAGDTCLFTAVLSVPAGIAPGTVAVNTTSQVTATIDGLAVTGDPASASLRIDALSFSKSFAGAAVAGGTARLSFTIRNESTTQTLNNISFTDNLGNVIPGLVATGLPAADPCGAGSLLTGTSTVSLTGGTLLPGGSCTFAVDVAVPASALPGSYLNETSDLFLDGISVGLPATDSLTILALDFGDAPDPTFPTVLASDGARHGVVLGFHLGASIDTEIDGRASPDAMGDDLATSDDEDGVVFITPLVVSSRGYFADVEVTASAPGLLNAWIDFNGNGSWADAGEQIFFDQPLGAGVNELEYFVPNSMLTGCHAARFRFDSGGGLSYDGAAADGEVEDYGDVAIVPPVDLEIINRDIVVDTTFVAQNSIAIGGEFTIFPDVRILAPARVVLWAGNEVIARSGLFVEQGAELVVITAPVFVPSCGP